MFFCIWYYKFKNLGHVVYIWKCIFKTFSSILHAFKFLKLQSLNQKQICSRLTITNQVCQKLLNQFQLWFSLACFPTSSWIQEAIHGNGQYWSPWESRSFANPSQSGIDVQGFFCSASCKGTHLTKAMLVTRELEWGHLKFVTELHEWKVLSANSFYTIQRPLQRHWNIV